MELIGYKRNPELDVTARQLAELLGCTHAEKNGMFFWGNNLKEDHLSYNYLNRAIHLGIVGKGKILIPVYKEKVKDERAIFTLHEFENLKFTFSNQSDFRVVHKDLIKPVNN